MSHHDQEQQEMYYQQQQQQQQQQQERQRQYEQKRRLDTEEDARIGTLVKIDDRFYANSGKDKDDGEDDYAPWNDKPDKNAEPAPSRTCRVVQQRMAPPEAGEKLRV